MNNTIKFSADIKDIGKRLDIFLSENVKYFTRSYIKKLINNNHVKLNENICNSSSTRIKHKDKIILNIIEKNFKSFSKKIELDIIFEDEDILVVNKA